MILLLLLLAITIEDNVDEDEAGRLVDDGLLILLAEQPIFINTSMKIKASHFNEDYLNVET